MSNPNKELCKENQLTSSIRVPLPLIKIGVGERGGTGRTTNPGRVYPSQLYVSFYYPLQRGAQWCLGYAPHTVPDTYWVSLLAPLTTLGASVHYARPSLSRAL